jgi:hypothetical protein
MALLVPDAGGVALLGLPLTSLLVRNLPAVAAATVQVEVASSIPLRDLCRLRGREQVSVFSGEFTCKPSERTGPFSSGHGCGRGGGNRVFRMSGQKKLWHNR